MKTTVVLDKAGRIVIPKPLRDDLQLEPGDTLHLEADGESVTLRPLRAASPLRKDRGVWVFHGGTKMSSTEVADAVDKIRSSRDRLSSGLSE